MMRALITILMTMILGPVVAGELTERHQKSRSWVEITIEGVPDIDKVRINSTYPVSAGGFIAIWKIGAIKATKKTDVELGKAIAAAYRKAGIFDRPILNVKSVRLGRRRGKIQTISLGGEIKTAGLCSWSLGETLGHAVKRAGGATVNGDVSRVKLYRNGVTHIYNLEIKEHREVKVQPKDLIEVLAKGINWKPTKK